jgi:foldase protein PrsA
MDQLEQAAFALEQDEISPIVEQDQRYYILKCVTAYDQEATAARKVRLMQERRANSFKELYDPFAEEHEVKLTDGIWDQVDFSQGENCTSEDFFQRYRICFNS